MKKIVSIILALLLVVGLMGCTTTENEKPMNSSGSETVLFKGADLKVACLKGPTGVGMANLMKADEQETTVNRYEFTVSSSPTEVNADFIAGKIDIASVPTNVAVTLNNKLNGGVVMLGVNTMGVLSILENGNSIKTIKDLVGKEIYSTGKGSNPEYILNYCLTNNGIDPKKDVTITYVETNDELVAALVSGKAEIAMVPEPAATTVLTKKNTLTRALDMTEEWSKIADSSLMMGCVIVKKDFLAKNPEAIDTFLSEYETALNLVESDVDLTAERCVEYQIIPSLEIAKKAIPACNVTYVSGTKMKTEIEGYFEALFLQDPTSLGGALPGEEFYYNNK